MMREYPKLKTIYNSASAMFNFQYPHASTYSYQTIETMLYNHFKNYGIAVINDEDDIDEWKEDFQARINEIMPTFNKLYDSFDLITNPLRTVDVHQDIITDEDGTDTGTIGHAGTDTGTVGNAGTNTGTVTSSGTDSNTRTDNLTAHTTSESDSNASHATSDYQNGNVESDKKFSDMPQGAVSNINDGYLTNYTKDGQISNSSSVGSGNDQSHAEGESATTNTGTVANAGTHSDTRTDNLAHSNIQTNNLAHSDTQTNNLAHSKDIDVDVTKVGYEGSAVAELMKKYREGIDNFNSQLINAVSDFFIMIYE